MPSIDDILSGLNISKVDYYKALSISTDEDYQIHLKRLPNSCFVNNYFTLGLSSWEANLDIQPVYNYYKAITYMCAYLSKTEDECSHAMNQAAQEAFLNNTDAYTKMKSIARAYTTKREVSVQEAVYLVMPELWLRKVFPGVLFANSNSPEKRYKVCLSEKEMSSLPDSSTAIFKRNMLDRYCDRPDNMFSSGRYEILNSFCFAEFLRYYSLKQNISNDCQPDELKNDIIEPNHPLTTYPTIVPLMNSSDKLRCRKVPLVLRYFEPNRDKHPEDYAHHLLFMFYPFREETELLSVDTKSHVGKLNEPGVLDVVNRNKQIIEPFSELVHDAFQNFIHDHVNETSFDPYAQQENEESYPDVNQEDTDNASSENVTNTSISSLILPDDDINAQIRSLNYQQKEVFDFVLQWAINFIKYVNCKLPIQIKPFNLFLTGGGGVGKSHLLTTIYNSVTKVLSYKNGHPDKKKILVLAPTGVASININGTTIHSGLSIPTKGKLYPLNDKNKTNLRMKLANVELIIIDEISMVSSMLFRNIDMRLQEIYLCDKPFGGKSIILCGDLYQLPPVQGKPVYTYDTTYMQGLLGLELWRSFVMAELTEVMRQKGNAMFINLLNQARLGTLDSEKLSVLKSRFISKNDKNYPSDIIHIYAENAPVDEHNSNMLDRLETPLILIQAIDQVPIDSELSNTDLSWVQNAKISETGGLLYSLRIKLGARVMITKNIDIDDKLINGQVGTIKYVQFVNNKVTAVFIQLDDETAGKKAMQSSNIGRSNSWVKVERAEAIFNTKRRFVNSPTIRRTQFPLMLSWACTCHKVQGLSLTSAVISFELFKQKQFNPGQMYVSLSRVTNLENLYLIGEYTENAIRINKKAETEYERLRHESLFIPFKNLNVSLDSLTITLLNVRSLSKHSSDIAADARLTATDIFCLTETQLLTESDVSVIETHLSDFKFEYNNCISHRFNSLAICYKKTSFIENCFKFSAISIIKFRKPSFSNEVVTLALIYRQPNHLSDNFLHRLSRILNDYDIDILLGDFNVDALDKCNTNLRNILQDYKLMNSEPTHLSGSLLDHVYLKKRLLDNKSVEVVTTNVFFSDHDAVTLKLSNN